MNIEFSSEAFLKRIDEITNQLPGAVQQALYTTGSQAVKFAQNTGLYKNRTGALTKSIRFETTGTQFERRFRANDMFYAKWVNYGNDPGGGRIYPKKAKALRFVINGEVFFRKSVKAAAPRPFFDRTVDILPNLLRNNLEYSVRRIIQ